MKKFKLCSPLYKIALDEHFFVKPVLLDYIEKSKPCKTETISKLDYSDCANLDREWIRFFRPIWKNNLQSFMQDVDCNDVRLQDMWFQQYNEKSDHHWHNHWYANWTNVYYVELPDRSLTTQLYDTLRKKIINVKLREGQLLTFPAHVMHRSPVNKSKERKKINFECFINF